MRGVVAGGTGAIGRHLVPKLVAAGHEVGATARSSSTLAEIRAWEAEALQAVLGQEVASVESRGSS